MSEHYEYLVEWEEKLGNSLSFIECWEGHSIPIEDNSALLETAAIYKGLEAIGKVRNRKVYRRLIGKWEDITPFKGITAGGK